jgi:hypothetical protein
MPPAMSMSRKIAVRAALTTGCTVATIIGAQTIAVQQQPPPDLDDLATAEASSQLPLSPTPFQTESVSPTPQPTIAIQYAAPSIVIVRQPNRLAQAAAAQPNVISPTAVAQPQSTVAQQAPQRQILPPQPVAIAAPDPVIVQPDPIVVQAPPIVVQSSGGGGGGQSSGHSAPRSHSS